MTHILFVDDEAFFQKDYLRELRKEYRVSFCEDAAEAIRFLDEDSSIKFLLLDIQMPTPQGVEGYKTNNSVDTGIYLLKMSKSVIIERVIPVIVLTNKTPDEVRKKITPLGYPDELLYVYQKAHTSAVQIAIKIGIMLRKWR